MKRNFVVVTLFALLGLSGCQPSAAPDTNRDASKSAAASPTKEQFQPAEIEAELQRLEREWANASINHDVETVKRVVAEDVQMTYPDGTTGTKSDEVRDTESGALTAESSQLVDPKVTILDANTAIVTGRTIFKNGKYKGPDGRSIDISGEYRFTDVFLKRNGQWQVIASQATKILNPAVPSPTPKSPSMMKPSSGPSPAASVKAPE